MYEHTAIQRVGKITAIPIVFTENISHNKILVNLLKNGRNW
jgi:hypothetical protein